MAPQGMCEIDDIDDYELAPQGDGSATLPTDAGASGGGGGGLTEEELARIERNRVAATGTFLCRSRTPGRRWDRGKTMRGKPNEHS